jgi:hypothetical protein
MPIDAGKPMSGLTAGHKVARKNIANIFLKMLVNYQLVIPDIRYTT